MLIKRIQYTFFKRHANVRPVHNLFTDSKQWQVNLQTIPESFIHDLTMFGPIIAAQNITEQIKHAWNSSNVS